MTTDAQKKALLTYGQRHKDDFTRVFIRLNNIKDKDIVDKLAAVSNKQAYIKNLIREDISKNGQ